MSEFNVNKVSRFFYQVSDKNNQFTAIATGQSSRGLTNINLANVKKDCSLLMVDTKDLVSSLKLQKTIESNSEYLFLYEQIELEELTKEWIPTKKEVLQLTKLYIYAKNNNIKLNNFSLRTTFKTKSGNLVIIPGSFSNIILNKDPKTVWWQSCRFIHPEREGESSYSFSLAVLAYLSLTKQYPFTSTEENSIRNEIRKKKIYLPETDSSLFELLDSNFDNQKEAPSLENWLETLKKSPDWSIKFDPNLQRMQKKEDVKVRRVELLRKHSGKILLASAISLVALLITVSVLVRVFRVPISRGLLQNEVLELYYKSINSLDIITADLLLIKDGKKHLEPYQNLLIITKLARYGSNINRLRITPNEWLVDTEKQPLPSAKVYGLMNIEISYINNDKYLVEYELFFPDGKLGGETNNGTKFIPPSIYMVSEEVTLSSKGKDEKLSWLISNVTELKREFITLQTFLSY